MADAGSTDRQQRTPGHVRQDHARPGIDTFGVQSSPSQVAVPAKVWGSRFGKTRVKALHKVAAGIVPMAGDAQLNGLCCLLPIAREFTHRETTRAEHCQARSACM
ncbi:hypothetical protein BGP84_17045 [Pseudomonas putida]|uniref:Uncharacterized protein n=1 Tax=Pseudomonas putida TaxID=303 RepID=A0A2S3X6X8_PSEPU|nr:hypothetical protein BGP84_17045 [Pseudomonas putida]